MKTQLPRRILTHEHRVIVEITLKCQHRHSYPLPIDSVAANPAYARPGVSWNCQACGPGYPPKSEVIEARYVYACPRCEDEPDDTAPAELPAFQRFEWSHRHDLPDIAGYVIVRSTPGEGLRFDLADVAEVPGINRYGHAMATVRRLDDETPPEIAHAIVPIYADGCRRDRDTAM